MPIRIVSYLQFFGEIFDAKSLAGEQHDEMVDHVGTLVDQSAVGAVTCLDDSFESLFAHLLCHTVDTVFEQRGGIAAFGHFLMTNVDEILQESEEE